MPVSILLYIITGLLVIITAFLVRQELRLRRFLRGSDARSIEDTIGNLQKEFDDARAWRVRTEQRLALTEKKLTTSIRGLSTIRFNPFKGTSGSNQSFATALLNEEKTGVVVSALYAHDRTAVFAKPILRGESQYELSPEETDALKKAAQDL